jgi:hypothetical protein
MAGSVRFDPTDAPVPAPPRAGARGRRAHGDRVAGRRQHPAERQSPTTQLLQHWGRAAIRTGAFSGRVETGFPKEVRTSHSFLTALPIQPNRRRSGRGNDRVRVPTS